MVVIILFLNEIGWLNCVFISGAAHPSQIDKRAKTAVLDIYLCIYYRDYASKAVVISIKYCTIRINVRPRLAIVEATGIIQP